MKTIFGFEVIDIVDGSTAANVTRIRSIAIPSMNPAGGVGDGVRVCDKVCRRIELSGYSGDFPTGGGEGEKKKAN